MSAFPDIDFMEAQRALSQARVEDFVRYIGRRLDERPDFAAMPFKDAWFVLLGGYLELCATPIAKDGDV